jgi:hypothetical protein
MHTIFWFKNLKGRDHLGRRRRIREDNIRTDLREIRREDVDWMRLAQARDQWQALVTYQEGLCSTELVFSHTDDDISCLFSYNVPFL